MNYYTVDSHLGHKNIFFLNKCTFETINEMDNTLINNWNATVTNKDDIYIIGDLIYKSNKTIESYLDRLNGNKHLIIGKHGRYLVQKGEKFLSNHFSSIEKLQYVKDGKEVIVLCHYPLVEWYG